MTSPSGVPGCEGLMATGDPPMRYLGLAPLVRPSLLADAVVREWKPEDMPLFRCDRCMGRFRQAELTGGTCRGCFESMPVAGLPGRADIAAKLERVLADEASAQVQRSLQEMAKAALEKIRSSRTHEQDAAGKVDVGGYEALVVASYSPDPLLPPDPDALGSMHWLQVGEKLYLASWDGPAGWNVLTEKQGYLLIGAPTWRYHSQIVTPAPLAPPEDPEIDRVWAAVQDLGKS